MLSTLQESKLDRRFTLLDTDHDDVISRADYEELATRLIEGSGVEPDGPEAEAVIGTLLDLWDELSIRADVDGDSGITRAEWTDAVHGTVLERNGFNRVIGPVAAAVLDAFDSDGDGVLDAVEYENFLTAMRVPDIDARASFERLDTDHNGELSIGEITVALRDFYTSTDPTAPGNTIYGRL